MFLSGANLLLLDEPTNHLDMASRAALAEVLESYQGSLLLVTHDRDLMQTVCNRFLVVSGGQLTPMEDALENYLDKVTLARDDTPSSQKKTESKNSRDKKRQAAQKRDQAGNILKRQRQQTKRLEAKIELLEIEHAELNQCLADADLYQAKHKEKLKKTLERDSEVTKELEKAMAEWESISLSME